MFDLSPVQLIIVVVIALLVFGPKRLPELARSLGRGVREFRGAVSGELNAPDRPARDPEPAPTDQTISTASAVPQAAPDELEGIVVSDEPPPPAARPGVGA
ncbi:MAG TPA: twin-arginine translocase TatA/TatE family subunit [Miltoncostaeaceae bacterium]|nr:twin-arginine translocase TatA/TatE family subunit [Miltoncostaeaceae bacterium]